MWQVIEEVGKEEGGIEWGAVTREDGRKAPKGKNYQVLSATQHFGKGGAVYSSLHDPVGCQNSGRADLWVHGGESKNSQQTRLRGEIKRDGGDEREI